MFRRASRRLWATPVFTVFAVISLALGVGVTTAIYSVVISLTRTPLAVPNGDRIAVIVGLDPLDGRRQTWRSVVSRADFEDLRRASTSLGEPAASAAFYQSIVGASVSEVVVGEAVTGNYFPLLGLSPARGRLIQPSDDASPSRIAVLGHQFWRARFGADPGIVGGTVRIGGEPFEIVGIAPETFGGLTDRFQSFTAVWVPLASTSMFPSTAAAPRDPVDRRRRQLTVLAALPPGTSLEPVQAEVAAVGARLDEAFPIDMRRPEDAAPIVQPRTWSLRTLAMIGDEADGRMATAELVVMALVALVLVVACTNLANLVLARGSSRRHELAVRRALGASRGRLILEELAETGLLAGLGAAGAFIVTRVMVLWFSSANLPVSQAQVVQLEPTLDVTTLTLAAASLLASLVVFGVAPAVQLTRDQLRPVLSAEGGSTGQLRWRTKRGLIAVQVAISLSFFLIAAFGARIVLAERARPSGVDVDRLAIGLFNFRLPPWDETRARAAVDRLMTLAPGEPGLDAVAVTSGMPFGTTYTPFADVTTADRPFLPGRDDYTFAPLLAATPSVFRTLGVSILRGRGFDARDEAASAPVVVVSEMTARQLFGMSDVVGREMLLRGGLRMADRDVVKTLTIIGVASDTDTQRLSSREAGAVYVPLSQHFELTLALVGRTSGDPADIIGPLKRLAQGADPDLVLDRPGPAAMSVAGAYVLVGVVSRVAGGLALLAMVLAMAGLFGVLSHLVARRTREMGLRLALGAEPRRIRWLVLGDGLRPVLSGIVLGLLLGGLGRLALRAAYDSPLTPNDAIVFAIAPLPILFSALLACDWPARRAARVDPNVALREL